MATELEAGPPPLEDMSDVLGQLGLASNLPPTSSTTNKQRRLSQELPHLVHTVVKSDDFVGNLSSGIISNVSKSRGVKGQGFPSINDGTTHSTTCNIKKNNSGAFGGLKKGFLFSSSQSKATQSTDKHKKSGPTDDSLPFLEKTNSQNNSLHFPEVENSLNSTILDKKDWLTDALLEKVAHSPHLSQHLEDQAFAKALAEFQTDPSAAVQSYQGNEKIQKFFQEFCQLLGDHFIKMSGLGKPDEPIQPSTLQYSQQPFSEEDDTQMKKILSNPEMRDILMDSHIQTLLKMLKTNPQHAQRFVHNAGRDLRMKINKLIDVGLLQMQPL